MSWPLVRKPTLVSSKELKGLSVSVASWDIAKAGTIERVGRGLYRAIEAPISINETILDVAKRVHRVTRARCQSLHSRQGMQTSIRISQRR
jgi:hypothetical protein